MMFTNTFKIPNHSSC